jgi:hypothetical protein
MPGVSVDAKDVTFPWRHRQERLSADFARRRADAGVAQVTLQVGSKLERLLAISALKVAANRLLPFPGFHLSRGTIFFLTFITHFVSHFDHFFEKFNLKTEIKVL